MASANFFEGTLPNRINSELRTLYLSGAAGRSGGVVVGRIVWRRKRGCIHLGEAFLLTVGAFVLTVRLLCLHSLKALIRRTFSL